VSLFAPLVTFYSQELGDWIQKTQGLCKINKGQFYKLFKAAFANAFSEQNIQSGFQKTGIYPFDPLRVLCQLSTKLSPSMPSTPSTSQPTTGSSGSQSVISNSDWRKINHVIKEAVGDVLGYEDQQVLKHMHSLHTENMLLKSQIEGLQEVLRTEKKQKKPKKGLFTELCGNEGNAAIFFLPAKISAARELQA
jgi:hypothetical protein